MPVACVNVVYIFVHNCVNICKLFQVFKNVLVFLCVFEKKNNLIIFFNESFKGQNFEIYQICFQIVERVILVFFVSAIDIIVVSIIVAIKRNIIEILHVTLNIMINFIISITITIFIVVVEFVIGDPVFVSLMSWES